MTEYINKQALLAEYDCVHVGPPGGARKLIEKAPTADVAPVVHGRWIPIKVPTGIGFLGIKEMVVGFIRCSECYMEFDVSCEWYSHYCPNCGARMDGE